MTNLKASLPLIIYLNWFYMIPFKVYVLSWILLKEIFMSGVQFLNLNLVIVY